VNKRKRMAWRKHRIKAKKRKERQRALPAALRQAAARRTGGAARGS
jgi:hypothetical protein